MGLTFLEGKRETRQRCLLGAAQLHKHAFVLLGSAGPPGVSMRIRMADERGSQNFLSVPSSKQLLTLYMQVKSCHIYLLH